MPPINLEMGNGLYKDNKSQENYVKIREGVVEQGIFDKDIFSRPSKGIVHVTYRDYGPTDTVNFIDAMQNTVEQFLVYNGFSVGISDLIADEQTRAEMDAKDALIRQLQREVSSLKEQLEVSELEMSQMKSELAAAQGQAEVQGQAPGTTNEMVLCVVTGLDRNRIRL
jgi:hypothetical protein